MGRGPWRGFVAGILAVTMGAPPLSAGAGVGTARGFRAVEVSLDSGKTWVPLGQRAFPLLEGAQVRSTTGAAVLSLSDRSRVTLLPSSAIELHEAGRITGVHLRSGRLTFSLPRETRVEIHTASARLEPERGEAMAGEVFVGESKLVGLRMTRGTMRVHELAGERRTMVASLQPVFVPKQPVAGAVFSANAPARVPARARGVYTPKGESLGYLSPASQLVLHPGFTRDLTQPFPQKFVQVAMAKIPEADRSDGTPLFDVNAAYVGYLANSGFYSSSPGAQAQIPPDVQVAQAVATEAPAAAGFSWTPVIIGGVLLVGVGTVTGLAASGQLSGGGGGGTGTPSTQLQP